MSEFSFSDLRLEISGNASLGFDIKITGKLYGPIPNTVEPHMAYIISTMMNEQDTGLERFFTSWEDASKDSSFYSGSGIVSSRHSRLDEHGRRFCAFTIRNNASSEMLDEDPGGWFGPNKDEWKAEVYLAGVVQLGNLVHAPTNRCTIDATAK